MAKMKLAYRRISEKNVNSKCGLDKCWKLFSSSTKDLWGRNINGQLEKLTFLQNLPNKVVPKIRLKIQFFIGGLPLKEDTEKCKNCHIAVGAPGRVKHLINKGVLKVHSVHLFVLDEADKLMESSFMSDVNEIFNSLPDRKQIIAVSATYPKELYSFLNKYMLSPTYVEVETESPLLLGLKQFVKIIEPYTSAIQEIKFKNEELLDLFSSISFTQCLIFTNYQTRAESIANFLNQKGWSSMHISGAQTQPQRLKTMKDLKDFKCKILLTTDLTARGIDAEKIDLVINYDIPNDALTYLHRMGRTGRYGSLGVCIDFVPNGPSLCQWQNMIGSIGGVSLGIPKLPKFQGTVLNLLKVSVPSEHCIFGTISDKNTPTSNIYIKNKILDLKQKEELNTSTSQGISYSDNWDCTWQSPSSCEYENLMSTMRIKSSNSLTKVPRDVIIRKWKSTDSKEQVSTNTQVNSSSEMSKTDVFDKNRVLMCITEIISNTKSIEDINADFDVVDDYLNHIKDTEKKEINEIMALTKSIPLADLLKDNAFDYKKKIDTHLTSENNSVTSGIENIFDLGYQYATKTNSSHWSTHLPKSELSKFQDFCAKEQNDKGYTEECDDHASSCEMEGESDEHNLTHESFDELATTKHFEQSIDENASSSQFMKWVPVEKSAEIDKQSDPSWEEFSSYFNHCGETLWQNGLRFQNIEDFDNWFYGEWQAQILNVRNYIQQNIYIQGMNKYRQSMYNSNKK